MILSEPLPHFVDDLLSYLHETHPTYATLDGVHSHDDLLEDLSRQAIESQVHALSGYLRRLDEIRHDALTEAAQSIRSYLQYLEADVAPRARASFRLGRERFEQKVRLDEGLSMPVDRLLAIATRELKATQEAFRSLAGRMDGGDPLEL